MKRVAAKCPYCEHANFVNVDTSKMQDWKVVFCDTDTGCGKVFALYTEMVVKKKSYKLEGQ